ncbi:MAG TPA: PepSY domain-containing protein [Tepidisphaeraceae bacterium]|nr:PepSY domain-containing protein [Tepidisphaeraceae bacterium]
MAALALTGIRPSTTRAADEQEENEVKITFKQAPSAVRKTLKREANGEKIKTVDKEKLKGKTVYEADVKIDGHNYEIVVDRHGLLIHKQLDEGEEGASASSKKESGKQEAKKSKAQAQDEDDSENGHSRKNAKSAKNEEHEDDDQPKARLSSPTLTRASRTMTMSSPSPRASTPRPTRVHNTRMMTRNEVFALFLGPYIA